MGQGRVWVGGPEKSRCSPPGVGDIVPAMGSACSAPLRESLAVPQGLEGIAPFCLPLLKGSKFFFWLAETSLADFGRNSCSFCKTEALYSLGAISWSHL